MTLEELIKVAETVDAKVFGDVRMDDLMSYLLDEIKELKDATKLSERTAAMGYKDLDARLNQIEEFGDVLFCLIAFARQNNIDIHQALSLTIIKLKDRAKQRSKLEQDS